MTQTWREILEGVEVEPQAAAGPAGAEGTWHELLAAFGTTSFLRVLTDGEQLALECAAPGDESRARGAFERGEWTVEGESKPWVVTRAFPEDADAMRHRWVEIARLADAVRADDPEAFREALAPEPSESKQPPVDGESPTGDQESADRDEPTAGSPFETIGEDDREVLEEGQIDWAVHAVDGVVEVALGFGTAIDTAEYERLEEQIVRNLRGKYDVDAQVVPSNEVQVKLEKLPTTRLTLRVTPDKVVSDATLTDAEGWVSDYLSTLAGLAKSGIEPLVFLGVRGSNRGSDRDRGSRSTESDALQTIGPSDDDEPLGDPPSLAIDDSSPDESDESDEAAGEVVFGQVSTPDPHDPLEPGRFDDPRLDRTDATTSLVDVVLRHPGYSDRRIGQVLSILLSLDYSRCLQIAERAPTVLAWGVARERAQTMKTVIEGAGGKVLLAEPDEFGEP